MNHYPSREQVQALRERYPPGTLLQLTADMQGERFQAGDIGKVTSVDDAGQIHLAWLKGGSLAIIPGVDSFREIITEPLDLNPYLENGNLRINGYYVDACTDNGIERADAWGKTEICEGYYCRIYKTEKDLFDGAYYDDFAERIFAGAAGWGKGALIALATLTAFLIHCFVPAGSANATLSVTVIAPVLVAAGIPAPAAIMIIGIQAGTGFLFPIEGTWQYTFGTEYYTFSDCIKGNWPITLVGMLCCVLVIPLLSFLYSVIGIL